MTLLTARSLEPFPNLGTACCPWCTYPCTPMDCANYRRTPDASFLLPFATPTSQGAHA